MIYLLRHGQTLWNRLGIYQGQQDSPLTARGIGQARAMGALLAEVAGSGQSLKIVSSPLGRAWQTAVIVAERLGIDPAEISLEPKLAEIAYGDWEARSAGEVARLFPEAWAARQADRWNFPVPGGESYAQVAARVRDWMGELDGSGPLVAVGHGGAGRILRGLYQGAGSDEIFAMDKPQDGFFRLQDGCVTRFEVAEADARL
ncbi:histidine phosphatase family protein [Pelagibius sp.]|uniref:histidine phosphatase family protein n=1 Tax=Pelagibius sp. TaxID=1931238 RepID=UPI0026054900|nr:histidine phosphatase family protein [Pelagibius sp.]